MGGKNNFQDFIIQTGTLLHETGDNFDFGVSGKNLVCVCKNSNGTKSTELHILNGNNNFQNFLVQTGTKLHETSDNFAFYAYRNTLFAFSKHGGSNTTEVHCLRM